MLFSASLYVGYVDDEETPEMIMKKFEMLDKIMDASNRGLLKDAKPTKAKKARPKRDKDDYAYERPVTPPQAAEPEPQGPDQVLSEKQLALLFRMTSTFNVPTDGYVESTFDGYLAPGEIELDDEDGYVLYKLQRVKAPSFLHSSFLSSKNAHPPYIETDLLRLSSTSRFLFSS